MRWDVRSEYPTSHEGRTLKPPSSRGLKLRRGREKTDAAAADPKLIEGRTREGGDSMFWNARAKGRCTGGVAVWSFGVLLFHSDNLSNPIEKPSRSKPAAVGRPIRHEASSYACSPAARRDTILSIPSTLLDSTHVTKAPQKMNKEDAVLKMNSIEFLLLPHTHLPLLLRSSSSRLRSRPAANLFTQGGRPAAARLAPASQN